MNPLSPDQINSLFPVIGLVLYPGGICVRRGCQQEKWQMNYTHERQKISMVKRSSMNRLALLVRSSGVEFRSLQTLTYGANYPLSGKIAKKHLNHFLIATKRNFGPHEYVWVLEFQERGAVHFHIATTLAPPSDLERELFALTWQRISTPYSWMYCQLDKVGNLLLRGQTLLTDKAVFDSHMSKKAWENVRRGDKLHGYFAKYANKLRQKEVPCWYSDVGRFWGASKGVALPDGQVFWGKEEQVRNFLWDNGRDVFHWRVLPKIILM